MEDNHRKRILKNIDSLINLTDFDKLSQACLTNELLTGVMLQNIYRVEPRNTGENWNEETVKRERHKRLFEKITKRGPEAFEKLHRIFINLKYREALKILGDVDERMISISSSKLSGIPTTTSYNDLYVENLENNNLDDRDGSNRQLSRSRSNDDSSTTLHKYDESIRPKKNILVQKALRIIKHPSIDTYPMESKNNRGVFFMVNIIDFPSDERRQGADEDAQSLLCLFKQLGFKLYAYTNITQNNFFKLLDELLNSDEIRDTECFVMALMTHGHMTDGIQRITFADGSVVKVEEIEKRFYHQNCLNLVGKPKIFIYPYCRGEIPDQGVVITSKIQTDSNSFGRIERRIKNIAQLSDVIKCYATSEGFLAHRDIENGSWYIQSLVDIMARHSYDTSFEEMLKLIQADIAKLRTNQGHLQTASYVNIGFNKILYFNPGV